MKTVVAMIHIPDYAEDCSSELLKQLKGIRDLLPSSLPIFHEFWMFDFDTAYNTAASYSNGAQIKEHWRGAWDAFEKMTPVQVTASITFGDPHKKNLRDIGISAVLQPHAKYYRLPRENGERWITIRITPHLWNMLDQEAFIQRIKEAYLSLNATYACIDENAPLGGIYEENFRLLTTSPQDYDIEGTLPGIHWLQIIDSRFISASGDINTLANHAPCERIEQIVHNNRDILLFQISPTLRTATRKRRLNMRAYFHDFLYNITPSLSLMKQINSFPYYKDMLVSHQATVLRDLKMMPLTDDEINSLFDELNAVEST